MNSALREQLASALGIHEPAIECTPAPSAKVAMVDNHGLLSKDVEKIILKFGFRYDWLVPAWVWRQKEEFLEERSKPNSPPGTQFWEPTEDVSGNDLRQMLIDEGFTLVAGHFKERLRGGRGSDAYHAVTFTFYRSVTNGTEPWKELGPSLDDLLERSVWTVRGYNNPLVRNGEIVENKRMISINMEAPAKSEGRFRTLAVENHDLIIFG